MPEEVNSSPEEKLLKVIRSGGTTETPAEPAPPQAKPAADTVAKAARTLQKQSGATPPKMKVPAAAAPPQASLPPPATPPAPAPDIKNETAPAPVKKPAPAVRVKRPPAVPRTAAGGWPGAVARALLAAAAAVVLLAGWDVRGHFVSWRDGIPGVARLPADTGALTADTPAPPDGEASRLPAAAAVLHRFRERPLFAVVTGAAETQVARRPDNAAPARADWERYAREHFKLLGFSVLDSAGPLIEAIVTDEKAGALFYLKTGDDFTVDGVRINVAEVGRDYLVLSDGTRRLNLK